MEKSGTECWSGMIYGVAVVVICRANSHGRRAISVRVLDRSAEGESGWKTSSRRPPNSSCLTTQTPTCASSPTRLTPMPPRTAAPAVSPDIAPDGAPRPQAAAPCETVPAMARHRSHQAARFRANRWSRAARLPASNFAGIPSPLPK